MNNTAAIPSTNDSASTATTKVDKVDVAVDSSTAKSMPLFDYILLCGDLLELPRMTVASAQIYIHRCQRYLKQMSQEEVQAIDMDEHLMAIACLHLACKSTETLRKVRDLINVGYLVLNPKQPYLDLDSKYQRMRDSLVAVELVVLRIMRFDVNVQTVHLWIINIIRRLLGPEKYTQDSEMGLRGSHHHNGDVDNNDDDDDNDDSNDDDDMMDTDSGTLIQQRLRTANEQAAWQRSQHPMAHALWQFAWSYANDSMRSEVLALDYSPCVVALACTLMALRMLQLSLPIPLTKWCASWGVSHVEQVQEAIECISSLYALSSRE
ncbi:cyclin-like protein [Syncephalis plumigaleata]|nr:cyclin-like protein [Syncephalis plumigaleata]